MSPGAGTGLEASAAPASSRALSAAEAEGGRSRQAASARERILFIADDLGRREAATGEAGGQGGEDGKPEDDAPRPGDLRPRQTADGPGFRTRREQEEIYASSLAEHGKDFTESYVASHGHSEHETGLAIDLALNRDPIDFLRPYFPRDGICGRFRSKAASYGFVERYQEGKEALTGIAPEPWHFRYVGLPHATIMNTYGFCLEEYLDYLKDFPYEGRHLEVHVENKSFELFYKKAEDDLTELTLPGYLPFQVSGDNREGFVFTLWR